MSSPLQEAECKKEMMDVKFLADTKMADSKRELEMQKAAFNQEVNTKVLMDWMSNYVSKDGKFNSWVMMSLTLFSSYEESF